MSVFRSLRVFWKSLASSPRRFSRFLAVKYFQLPDEYNMEGIHRNRKHPQLWMARDKRLVLRAAAPYVVGFLSPPFDRLDVVLNLFQVVATRTCRRDRGMGAVQ